MTKKAVINHLKTHPLLSTPHQAKPKVIGKADARCFSFQAGPALCGTDGEKQKTSSPRVRNPGSSHSAVVHTDASCLKLMSDFSLCTSQQSEVDGAPLLKKKQQQKKPKHFCLPIRIERHLNLNLMTAAGLYGSRVSIRGQTRRFDLRAAVFNHLASGILSGFKPRVCFKCMFPLSSVTFRRPPQVRIPAFCGYFVSFF